MSTEETIVQKSLELAEEWQNESNRIKSKTQVEFDEKVAKMVRNPVNKVFLTELIDQSFRPTEAKRVADQLEYLLNKYENVDLFDSFEELLIELFHKAGRHLPKVSVPAVINRIRQETATVILAGERDPLVGHIKRRKEQKIGVNLNVIGESLLGEDEAEKRLQTYERTLTITEVNYISIKISTIYSQITSIAFDETIAVLVERLTRLFRCAQKNTWMDKSGKLHPKFINLDMEEYRDLELTVKAFKATLDLDEFRDLEAGIVLQAYLPDALEWQKELTEWAQLRVRNGGAPIKLRVVKGANMDMEQTEASMRGWPQAPYREKLDTDANYKNMLNYAMTPERASCVKLGIASHNLFELAHAYILASENEVLDYVVFEMLEGMADATAKTIHKAGMPILLYAPVAEKKHFTHAIAYYVRRLDENTSPQNFLTHCFDLKPGDPDWQFLASQFKASYGRVGKVRSEPYRFQDRFNEEDTSPVDPAGRISFQAEPDTDWTLRANREWARSIVENWKAKPGDEIEKISVSVGEKFCYEGLDTKTIIDQSQHEESLPIASYALATVDMIDEAVEIAASDESGWAKLEQKERYTILLAAARELRLARADLIGVAAAEVGKIFTETDPEVSEAVDFAEFYPFAMQRFTERPNLKFRAKGVGVVIPPWNFPIAIPAGGVLASLAAGNNTILKPSPQATYCSWVICKALWKAGVPKSALQFLPCKNDPEATHLVEHPKTSFVIFTGSTKTALSLLGKRPRLPLYAETGGKNAMIISAVADKDRAIADIVQSAFGNTGQKCSATSLVLLQRSLYEDREFRDALVDACQSLGVGYAWNLKNKLGPLANPVGGALKEAIESLKGKEEWALKPRISPTNPHLLTPGIIWNVSQDSYCYQNELFGPVIGVMPYDTLAEAIRLVNETDYGLTSGLQSLDEREIKQWREGIRAGNLYINRGTTGAIVMRQPFGGMAKSAIGAGIKVGGWNYVLEFAEVDEVGLPTKRVSHEQLLEKFRFLMESYPHRIDEETTVKLRAAFESSLYEYEKVFSRIEDYFKIRGEANQSRYLKMHDMMVRIEPSDSVFSIFSRLYNATLSGTSLTVSVSPEVDEAVVDWLRFQCAELKSKFVVETQDALCRKIRSVERMRFASPDAVGEKLCRVAAKHGVYIASSPPLIDGRLELVLYFREQCVTHCFHRYGNLGQHQLNPHAEDVLSPGALPDEVYRTIEEDDEEE